MQKNSITNKITPCCGLPFSVIYWWVSNLTLNSEADREFIISKISQGGIISIDAWKVLINSGTLEADASLTKAEFLAWFDCGRQPSCEQLKLLIEGYKIGNYNPADEYGVGWTETYLLEEHNGKLIKKITGYVGGVGTLPDELNDRIGLYLGDEILTANKDLAIDFRGQDGANGTAEIPDWVAGDYPEKSLVIKDNSIWRVADGEIANVGDVPGVSDKWISLGGGDLSFKTLSSNNWNGENSTLNLNSNMNLILDTSKTYGILEIRKDFYSRNTLKINGRNIKLPFGNVLLSFVKIGNFYNFYVEKFSQTAKESSVNPQPIRNKIFTGSANDVVISNDPKFNLSQFSVSFSAKISANKFIAVSKGTTGSRNWDVIFTNLNTGNDVDLQFNIGSASISAVGNPLDTFINIVATFDGSVGKLYRNGTLLNTGNATLSAGGQLMIGEVLNLYSTGEISDLFITNKALNQSEITEYNSSSDKSPLTKSFSSSVVEYFNLGNSVGVNLPEIQYVIPTFSIYPKPVLMRGSKTWKSGDIANPDLTVDEKKMSGYNYILQYSAYGTTDLDTSPKWRTALAFSNDFTDVDSWIVDTEFCFEPIAGEGYIAANGSIVIKDEWFYLFYQTGNSADVGSSQIRVARSRNLKTWTRLNNGNPVIQRTESYESAGAYDPMVRLNEAGLFEMVYCTYNGSQNAIGYAISADGIAWNNKKLVVGLNSNGTSEPCICKIGDRYLISADLYNGSVRNIYGAFWDGINPIVANTMVKMVDGVDDWNSVSCFDSYCFLKDESIYCFFAGGVTTSGTQGLEAQIGISKADLIFN